MLVDTHAHLNFPQFSEDREEVIERARLAGVTLIVNIGTDIEVSREATALAEQSASVFATAGVHPHDVERVDDQGFGELPGLLSHEKVVAVGETGLDFFRDYSPGDLQEESFRRHIRLSRETGLPIVVHSRAAEDRVLDLVEEEGEGEVRGVLHCFGGNLDQVKRGIDLGFVIGFGGSITYRKSTSLALALKVSSDCMVLETDAPYLAPQPYRGKRNEPAYVRTIAEFLAGQRHERAEDFFRRTTQNALRLYGIPEDALR